MQETNGASCFDYSSNVFPVNGLAWTIPVISSAYEGQQLYSMGICCAATQSEGGVPCSLFLNGIMLRQLTSLSESNRVVKSVTDIWIWTVCLIQPPGSVLSVCIVTNTRRKILVDAISPVLSEVVVLNVCIPISLWTLHFPLLRIPLLPWSFSHDYPYLSSARELLVLVVDCTSSSEYLESIKTILRSIVASYRDEVDIRKWVTAYPF